MCIRDRLRWLERTPDKRKVGGSSPLEPTSNDMLQKITASSRSELGELGRKSNVHVP